MKKIVPFKKEIKLNDLDEIVSIALEHTYRKEDNKVVGEFSVNGEYKSNNETKPFLNNLPFQINLDDKYIIDNLTVDINDFYYETDNNFINLTIELVLNDLEERCIEEEVNEVKSETLFKEDIGYSIYRVYIVKEGDTIESILNKYNITKEELGKYNDLTEIKYKDKLIIPTVNEEI